MCYCAGYFTRSAAKGGEPQHRHCADNEKVTTLFIHLGSLSRRACYASVFGCVFQKKQKHIFVFSRDGSVHISCVEQNNGRPEFVTIAATQWLSKPWDALNVLDDFLNKHNLTKMCQYVHYFSEKKFRKFK